MPNKALALIGLTLSLSANAAIIDMDTITRDTDSGLDWLDLSETTGRSAYDISNSLGEGQEFEGWRFATSTEVSTLWANLGLSYNLDFPYYFSSYSTFKTAVNLLGNTYEGYTQSGYDYEGVVGWTGTITQDLGDGVNLYQQRAGLYLPIQNGNTSDSLWVFQESAGSHWYNTRPYIGSYLVQQSAVPVPSAAWLFGSALIGLAGIKRKK